MCRRTLVTVTVLLVGMLLLCNAPSAVASVDELANCAEFAFSTEEDFLSQGPKPADGNPIISDGDLLSKNGVVCMRNRQLLKMWDPNQDLGLDAADVIDIDGEWVAFSTELDDPSGRFRSGDLLATNGVVIPVVALLTQFQVGYDMGLDAIHFVGKPDNIVEFLSVAAEKNRVDWLDSDLLIDLLTEHRIDIWFSVESTERTAATTQILDGDLLSVVSGQHVIRQRDLFPTSVPAGIQQRGVDFGMDAATASRGVDRKLIRFSTEILYVGRIAFTDGDVLRALTANVEVSDDDLVNPFEPKARFLGLDALYMKIPSSPNFPPNGTDGKLYLPQIEVRQPVRGGRS